ncbi:hypothetical protein QUF74_09500 [Candidatus Halobeggiatoa sp. HSG11]|nr:hypothetical protein [Candidatus Halobeggiatoa sp. HSG11]
MNNIFTTEELTALASQVDEQLRELSKYSSDVSKRGDETQLFSVGKDDDLPSIQRKAIEDKTSKKADSFLEEFADKAKEVLCDADSDLRKKYDMFGDADKVVLLERFAGFLAAMGFSGIALEVLLLAITVFVIHIGLTPFAKKYCK